MRIFELLQWRHLHEEWACFFTRSFRGISQLVTCALYSNDSCSKFQLPIVGLSGMPKKRSPKDQARVYTAAQRARLQPPLRLEQPIKDVTTQLHELRIEQARERHTARPVNANDPAMVNGLGFTPANYSTISCPSTIAPVRRAPGPAPPRSSVEREGRKRRTFLPMIVRSRTETVPPFPGLESVRPTSLMHHTLLALGTYYFDLQLRYIYYLPQLGFQI